MSLVKIIMARKRLHYSIRSRIDHRWLPLSTSATVIVRVTKYRPNTSGFVLIRPCSYTTVSSSTRFPILIYTCNQT